MKADPPEEMLVPLKDVPKLPMIGPRRNGGRLDVRTAFRWAKTGSNGVVLWTQMQGGQRYTSLGALHRFFDAVTKAKARGQKLETPPKSRESTSEVETKLDRLGF
jgi:hypothetical protein